MPMKVFDDEMNPVESPDLSKGQIRYESKEVTWRYVLESESQGHYEIVQEYPNGGKDVEWIVDVPEVGHWEARLEDGSLVNADFYKDMDEPSHTWDKREQYETTWSYGVYTPYTQEELGQIEKDKEQHAIEEQIGLLKDNLANTDYIVMKIMEYQINGVEMPEDDAGKYADIILQRDGWRKEINELSSQLDGGDTDA